MTAGNSDLFSAISQTIEQSILAAKCLAECEKFRKCESSTSFLKFLTGANANAWCHYPDQCKCRGGATSASKIDFNVKFTLLTTSKPPAKHKRRRKIWKDQRRQQ
uniref:Apple domain-containing protein n=1 Tax=Romanomermis culicivorax TaxID=13658 RepID=A0A915KD94_ROMCU